MDPSESEYEGDMPNKATGSSAVKGKKAQWGPKSTLTGKVPPKKKNQPPSLTQDVLSPSTEEPSASASSQPRGKGKEKAVVKERAVVTASRMPLSPHHDDDGMSSLHTMRHCILCFVALSPNMGILMRHCMLCYVALDSNSKYFYLSR